jgi:hypothetical protein
MSEVKSVIAGKGRSCYTGAAKCITVMIVSAEYVYGESYLGKNAAQENRRGNDGIACTTKKKTAYPWWDNSL